jgi:DNA-damage-inducible protein J
MGVAQEVALVFDFSTDLETHDAWFRSKVLEALDDAPPAVSHKDVEAYFARRRAAAVAPVPGKA